MALFCPIFMVVSHFLVVVYGFWVVVFHFRGVVYNFWLVVCGFLKVVIVFKRLSQKVCKGFCFIVDLENID